jgi:ribonuclease BN (tRNA processing enzyme)
MRLTVIGGVGAWPTANAACSGYLVEEDDFRLLVDPGFATLPLLLSLVDAVDVSAVYVSHGHPDHCADLNPLLRSRVLRPEPADVLPVYAPAGALDAVLRMDDQETLGDAVDVRLVADGDVFEVGPFTSSVFLLSHWLPNLGLRLASSSGTLAYTGDSGPSANLKQLALGADLLIAEASYPQQVPTSASRFLSSAADAANLAAAAGVGQLVLTHLMPFEDSDLAEETARAAFPGPVAVAKPNTSYSIAGDNQAP